MNKDFFDEHAARETFERFLFEMDDRIEGLQAAAAARNLTLDLSLESLSELESFIEDTMSRTPTTNHKESLLITAGRYLGEVVRERFGGQWELPLSDPSNVNYNQPVVMRHGAEGLEFAPVSVIRGFVKKSQRGLLARAVASQVSPAKLDLAELVWKEKTSDV